VNSSLGKHLLSEALEKVQPLDNSPIAVGPAVKRVLPEHRDYDHTAEPNGAVSCRLVRGRGQFPTVRLWSGKGELCTVKAINGENITLDDSRVINLQGPLHLDHGIAVKSHAAQGKTVDQVLVSGPVAAFSQVKPGAVLCVHVASSIFDAFVHRFKGGAQGGSDASERAAFALRSDFKRRQWRELETCRGGDAHSSPIERWAAALDLLFDPTGFRVRCVAVPDARKQPHNCTGINPMAFGGHFRFKRASALGDVYQLVSRQDATLLPYEVVVDRMAARRVGTSGRHAFAAHRGSGALPRILLPAGDPEINKITSHLRLAARGRHVIFYIIFVSSSIPRRSMWVLFVCPRAENFTKNRWWKMRWCWSVQVLCQSLVNLFLSTTIAKNRLS
jgi:hypothetical protein